MEVVAVTAASLIGLALFVTAGLYAAHRWDEWADQKRDALARERCIACQSDLPLICLTISPVSAVDLCNSHYKRYRSISELEYETDMWKRRQA